MSRKNNYLIKLIIGYSIFTGIIAIVFLYFFTSKQNIPQPQIPAITPSITINSPTGTPIPDNIFCGGIAGIQCPAGYTCKLSGNYPDAGGVCIRKGSKPTCTPRPACLDANPRCMIVETADMCPKK